MTNVKQKIRLEKANCPLIGRSFLECHEPTGYSKQVRIISIDRTCQTTKKRG